MELYYLICMCCTCPYRNHNILKLSINLWAAVTNQKPEFSSFDHFPMCFWICMNIHRELTNVIVFNPKADIFLFMISAQSRVPPLRSWPSRASWERTAPSIWRLHIYFQTINYTDARVCLPAIFSWCFGLGGWRVSLLSPHSASALTLHCCCCWNGLNLWISIRPACRCSWDAETFLLAQDV